jgi:signal peptidase I
MRGLRLIFGHAGGAAALIFLAILFLYLFGYRGMRFFLVPSGSMEPTLLREDYIVTLKEPVYQRGDVVVLHDPEGEGDYIVKRVVGLGGDVIRVFGGALYVNGEYVSEPYVLEPADYDLKPVRVAEGHAFFLGDSRNNSDDSHLWKEQSQPLGAIVGKVRFIYFPYARFGPFREHHPVSAAVAVMPQRPDVL